MTAARVPRLIFGLSLVVPLAAFAQSASEDYALVGAGLRARPAYDGAASERGELVPVLRYYGRPWFARTTQGILEGGARTELARGLNLGAQLAYEGGRLQRESAFLRGHNLADINPSASVGAHLEWDRNIGPIPVTLLARARQNMDTDLGAQADLRFTGGIYDDGRLAAGVFAQATWANAKVVQSQPRVGSARQRGGAAPARRRGAQPARRRSFQLLRERGPRVPVLNYSCRRVIHSATSTGFASPSRSTITFQVICTPPGMSSRAASRKRARTREPAGTGPVKRKRFRP